MLEDIRTIQRERRELKAISHHPELDHIVHVSSLRLDQVVGEEIKKFVGYARVYNAYIWVHKAISKIAEAIAFLPFRVVDAEGEEILNHPLTLLYQFVNDSMSAPILWTAYTVHMMLAGESFHEFVPDSRGRPVEIWPRRPDYIAITPDLSRPQYPIAAGYVYDDTNSDPLKLDATEMSQDRFFNPLSDFRGIAPINAIRNSIIIDVFAQTWSKAFLKRGARPDYAIVAPDGLTPTERQDYEDTLQNKYGGLDNVHKPMVIEKGVTDIKVLSFPPKDLEWLEQRKMSRDEVGSIFGVPDIIMGYGPETYDTEEKMISAMRAFWTLTLVPFIRHRDIDITSFWTKTRPLLESGQRMETDLSSIGILQEDVESKIPAMKALFSVGVPFDKIDERLSLGIGQIEGGNVGYLPINLIPVSGSSEFIDESPVEPSEEIVEPEEPEQESARQILKQLTVPAFGSPRHKALVRMSAFRWLPIARAMAKKLEPDFEKQKRDTLRNLNRLFEEKQNKPHPPQESDEIFDLEEWIAFFTLAYEPFFTDAVRSGGDGVLAQLGSDLPFDLGNPLVQRAIRTMKIQFATDINETTQQRIADQLRDILSEADKEGWGIFRIQEEMEREIAELFDVRKTLFERERIARTEMHKAAEMGGIEGARQSGIALMKAWLASLDGRERDTHREAHLRYQNDPIPLDALFEVGADTMPAPGLGTLPEENINCRGTVIYIPVEEPT